MMLMTIGLGWVSASILGTLVFVRWMRAGRHGPAWTPEDFSAAEVSAAFSERRDTDAWPTRPLRVRPSVGE
jgi:hypothetical protein